MIMIVNKRLPCIFICYTTLTGNTCQ